MSTKTSIKRLALVAVVALGLGTVSAVSAHAAEATPQNIVVSKVTTVAGDPLAVGKYVADKVLNANGVSSITVTAGSAVVLKAIPVGGASQNGSSYRLKIGSSIWDTEANAAGVADGTAETANTFTAPTTAGTYSSTLIYDEDADYTTTGDQRTVAFTLIVSAAAGWDSGASTVLSAKTHINATTTTDAVAKSAVKTLGTYVGTIVATIRDTDGAYYTGQTVTASVSGPGFVGGASAAAAPATDAQIDTADGAATTTRTVSVTDTTGVVAFAVWGDGTAGTSTVTISVTDQVTGATTTVATKTFTFYSDTSKLEVAKSNFTIGLAGGDTTGYGGTTRTAAGNLLGALDNATTVPAFVIKETDSSGRLSSGGAPTVVPTNTAVVASGTCALDDGGVSGESSGDGVGYYNCSFTTSASAKSGDKTTLTFRIVDPADATKYLTATADVTVGGSVSTEAIAFDKSSYAAGEGMVIIRTAKDASGNPVADGTASPAVTFSKSVGGTTPAAGLYVAGTSRSSAVGSNPSVFAPSNAGDFKALATSGNAAASALSASASVADANTAVTAQIASLIAKINALSKLIAKIQKKLGVK